MALVTNADGHARVWNHLVNSDTERTLELAPDEQANVDLPEGFFDPYLQVVPERATRVAADVAPEPEIPGAEIDQAASSADEPKE